MIGSLCVCCWLSVENRDAGSVNDAEKLNEARLWRLWRGNVIGAGVGGRGSGGNVGGIVVFMHLHACLERAAYSPCFPFYLCVFFVR